MPEFRESVDNAAQLLRNERDASEAPLASMQSLPTPVPQSNTVLVHVHSATVEF